MAILAIRGHKTRGKEVIEILEMLGGKNKTDSDGLKWFNGTNVDSYYTIEGDNYIHMRLDSRKGDYIKFILEEFLEKFPYKIGDKVFVTHPDINKGILVFEIGSMMWCSDTDRMLYKKDEDDLLAFPAENIFPYKEQTYLNPKAAEAKEEIKENLKEAKTIMEETIKIDIPKGYEFVGVDDNNQQVVLERIKPQSPKTYEECCKLLNKATFISFEGLSLGEVERYKPYIKLCRCRDAYWKMAGDWKPLDAEEGKTFCIYYNRFLDELEKASGIFDANAILDFPTEEMRDNFFENFKDLIEECKELL